MSTRDFVVFALQWSSYLFVLLAAIDLGRRVMRLEAENASLQNTVKAWHHAHNADYLKLREQFEDFAAVAENLYVGDLSDLDSEVA